MKIKLSDHFTYPRLFKFVFPSIAMMLFTSIYVVIDGIFVSMYAGKTAFAALNLIWPILSLTCGSGYMISTGGSALVGRYLGKGEQDKAEIYFSMLVCVTIATGIILGAIGLSVLKPVAMFFGAKGEMMKYCLQYGGILLISMFLNMLQIFFQFFLITAGKPGLNLAFTIAAGLTNMVLDFVFVGLFHWGISGAALATAASQFVGGALPLIYFWLPNTSHLRLRKTYIDWKALWKTCSNGVSELLSNISGSLVTILYNFQLMKIAGENGIAAYGVLMYVTFFFMAICIGYSYGCAPIVSFNLGSGNTKELKNIFRKSVLILGVGSLLLTLAAEIFAEPMSRIFVGYDAELLQLTIRGFRLYSFSFLISGFNIFGSSFFTALNDGPVSAILSFMRTLVFQVSSLIIMPLLFRLDGIWTAIIVAEGLAFLLTLWYLNNKKDQYHYI